MSIDRGVYEFAAGHEGLIRIRVGAADFLDPVRDRDVVVGFELVDGIPQHTLGGNRWAPNSDMAADADLDAVIDSSRLGRFQVIGMVAPSIAAAWHVPPAAFGPVFGLGLFGGLIGVVTLGSASDRFGRKPVLVTAILLFASVSLLTPLTASLPALMAVRFVAGLGMGGALPGLIATGQPHASRHHNGWHHRR
jgi:hypothetical protein